MYGMVYVPCIHMQFSTPDALRASGAAFDQIRVCASRLSGCVSCSWVSFPDQYWEMKPEEEAYFFRLSYYLK